MPPATPEEAPDQSGLSHIDAHGRASMVDISGKAVTARVAIAEARMRLDKTVRAALMAGNLPKGEALAVARIAGIQAAKETSRLIPLCHPLALAQVRIDIEALGDDSLRLQAEVRTTGATGVEMEALTAVTVAALTVYDMVKALCREAVIEQVQLLHKSGGKSGTYERAAAQRSAPSGTNPADSPGSAER